MNVLDVYPQHSWWFETRIPENVDRLRNAVAIVDDKARAAALNNIDNGAAYCMAGNAAFYELEPCIFDLIEVRYEPTVLTLLLLKRKLSQWVVPGGRLIFPEGENFVVPLLPEGVSEELPIMEKAREQEAREP